VKGKESRREDLAAVLEQIDEEEDLVEIPTNHLEDLAADQREDSEEMLTDQTGNHQKCTRLYAINAAKNAKCHSSRQAASQYIAVIALEKMMILLQEQALGQEEDQTILQKTLQKSIRNLIRLCRH